jgi:hypothetical protein
LLAGRKTPDAIIFGDMISVAIERQTAMEASSLAIGAS